MAGRLEGKVAFITGVARGQGRAEAVRLAEEGADIIGIDLLEKVPNSTYTAATQADLDETIAQVEALDRRIIATKADVRDFKGIKAAVDDGVAQLGKLDVVVANAGVTLYGHWDEITEEMWETTLATNLTGPWNTLRACVPHLIENGGGSIIITSSIAGLRGYPFMSAYTASKHGVVGLMRAYATELAAQNIRVNTIHPTGVNTPHIRVEEGLPNRFQECLDSRPDLSPIFHNLMPYQVSEPFDQANAVLFLASDEARMITGITLPVDAGTMQW